MMACTNTACATSHRSRRGTPSFLSHLSTSRDVSSRKSVFHARSCAGSASPGRRVLTDTPEDVAHEHGLGTPYLLSHTACRPPSTESLRSSPPDRALPGRRPVSPTKNIRALLHGPELPGDAAPRCPRPRRRSTSGARRAQPGVPGEGSRPLPPTSKARRDSPHPEPLDLSRASCRFGPTVRPQFRCQTSSRRGWKRPALAGAVATAAHAPPRDGLLETSRDAPARSLALGAWRPRCRA
jgi:hypothetical protein